MLKDKIEQWREVLERNGFRFGNGEGNNGIRGGVRLWDQILSWVDKYKY